MSWTRSLREFTLCAVSVAVSGFAPAGDIQLDLSWHTIDGGGGASFGGGFAMFATIGQHDASSPSAGGGFTLVGGFIPGVSATPAVPACPADFNSDSQVNAADLAVLLGAWSIPVGTPGCGGASPCAPDINNDAFVNAADLALLLGAWGPCA